MQIYMKKSLRKHHYHTVQSRTYKNTLKITKFIVDTTHRQNAKKTVLVVHVVSKTQTKHNFKKKATNK